MKRVDTHPDRKRVVTIVAALLCGLLIWSDRARAEPMASVTACRERAYAPQTLDYSQPINLGQLKRQIYFYICSGGYDDDLNKVLAAARIYVEMRASQVANPALVLDIDETSLSNLPIEMADDFAFIQNGVCSNPPKEACGWKDWIRNPYAKAIDGTLALFKAAKAHGVAVFFITGRRLSTDTMEDDPLYKATANNLQAANYANWDGLTLRPKIGSEEGKLSVTAYKTAARAKIAERYTIIANVGDQRSDLDGGYAERAYKLPNPFYFIP